MKYLIFIFLLISCGKAPLFGPIETPSSSDNPSVNPLTSSDELTWKDSRYHFAISWEKEPVVGENTPFKIKFWDSYQTNFLGPYSRLDEELCVFLWMKMSSGEHGTSPFEMTKVNSPDGDYYHFDQVYFIMSGKWELRVRTVSDQSQCNSQKTDSYLEEVILEITI